MPVLVIIPVDPALWRHKGVIRDRRSWSQWWRVMKTLTGRICVEHVLMFREYPFSFHKWVLGRRWWLHISTSQTPFLEYFFYSTEMRFRWGFARQAKHLSATVFLFSSTCAIDTSTASKFGDLISTASKFGDLISDRFKIRRFDFRSIYGVPLKMRWIPPKSIFLGSPPHFPGKYGWSAPRVFFRPISSIFFQY